MPLYQGFRWDRWLEGLINSILGSVSSVIVGYSATAVLGEVPDIRVLGAMAGTTAVWNFFSYIKDHLPRSVEVVEESKTTVTPSSVTQRETKTTTTTEQIP